MTNPIGDTLSAGSGGNISQQINQAAAPSQAQTKDALKASTGALNEAAQATSPNAGTAADRASGTPPPSGAASATGAANADPNAPRPAGA